MTTKLPWPARLGSSSLSRFNSGGGTHTFAASDYPLVKEPDLSILTACIHSTCVSFPPATPDTLRCGGDDLSQLFVAVNRRVKSFFSVVFTRRLPHSNDFSPSGVRSLTHFQAVVYRKAEIAFQRPRPWGTPALGGLPGEGQLVLPTGSGRIGPIEPSRQPPASIFSRTRTRSFEATVVRPGGYRVR